MNREIFEKLSEKEQIKYKENTYIRQVVDLLTEKLKEIGVNIKDITVKKYYTEWIEVMLFYKEKMYITTYHFYTFNKSISWTVSDIIKDLRIKKGDK